jgi:hypothetical protein
MRGSASFFVTTHLLPLDPSPAASAVVVALVRRMFHSFWG